MKTKVHQLGISIVELMVALLLGVFIILGVVSIFINTKAIAKFQDERLNNQSGVRLSELLFGDLLGQAGYMRAPDQLAKYAFPYAAANQECQEFSENQVVTPLFENGVGIGVCIRYQPASRLERDCQGNLVKVNENSSIDTPFVPTDTSELVILAIKFKPENDLDKGSILCKNLNSSIGVTEYTPIISNVADGKLQFWVSEGDDTGSSVDRFISFSDYKKLASKPDILGVNFYLLFASSKNMSNQRSKALDDWLNNFVSNNQARQRLLNNDNKRIYQVASGAQVLRNKIP
ncbi:hypothetical protein VQ643_01800 [Pseudomonas sp. F1_0610]|uniref:PilW family protein n=1 Tax=Pseudomonas sp. F1_0610 TaxID=3114284 RepID=UPI0039C42429